MNIKILFAVLATLAELFGLLPYIKEVVLKKIQPHPYTWLIWGITQSVAVAGLWIGGGGIGALSLTITTLLIIITFFLSIRGSSKIITKQDAVVLAAALLSIIIWVTLDSPLLAVLLVSAIDVVGYIPTFRKSYNNPWSEKLSSWIIFSLAKVFAYLALANYNFLTISYIAALFAANGSLSVYLFWRRTQISKKATRTKTSLIE